MGSIAQGISLVFQLNTLIYIAIGTVLGIIFGALPGLTATMAVALLVPLTFSLEPIAGMGLLVGAYCGGIAGGSVAATLLRIPGTPSSICTTFDAFPMARKGQAGLALGTSVLASFIGGIFSSIALTLIAPQLARFALSFGPTEYFALAILGLTIIASISAKSLIKGIIAGLVGVFASLVGTDAVTGMTRFTFKSPNLLGGISLLPALIGLFAVSQAFCDAETMGTKIEILVEKGLKGQFPSLKRMFESWRILLSSSVIGTLVGILPGAGGSIASFVAYDQAKRMSKTPEEFGTGCLDGVIASETSNNAVTGGALVPLLTLGIPGDSTTAVMLGGLLIHGLRPGPLLFKETPEIVYGIFTALFLANLFMLIFQFFGIRVFVHILRVPRYLLTPLVLTLCVIGSYATGGGVFDVKMMILFGVIGYFFQKRNYGVAPVVLGLILGGMAETQFRRAFAMYDGSLSVYVTRPITLTILILSVVLLILPYIQKRRERKAAVANEK